MTDSLRRSWQERLASDRSMRRISLAMRLSSVLLGVIICAFQGTLGQTWDLALLLAALSLIVESGWSRGLRSPLWTLVDFAGAGLLLGVEHPFTASYLPYLVAAAASAGVRHGLIIGLSGIATSAVTLFGAAFLTSDGLPSGALATVAEWLLMSVLAVVAGSWSRAWEVRFLRDEDRYQAAYNLLIRLREVTRRLPAGLDDITAATTVLDLVQRSVPFDRGAILRIDGDGPPQPLVVHGGETIPWYPDEESWVMRRMAEKDAAAQAMAWIGASGGRRAHRVFRSVLPIAIDRTRIGLVILQRSTPWSDDQLVDAQRIVDQSALMLDTAFVFGDIRSLATTEERHRLAREIHDGVAQELAGLAYVVDDASARADDPELRADLHRIRDELSRVVSELRLSIFELRSGVDPGTGLGASISTYVRQIGGRAGMTVHLVLEEDATRLPTDVEVEIMRIVQEAVTNARRHSRAKNLWVTLRTTPPNALVRIADDGVGITDRRSDSYGLDIMRERAQRVGGRLDVRQRVGGGTVVDLNVGDSSIQTGADRGNKASIKGK
ncbi:MAG: sensor histidine kinase [Actinobacteria bacterium]|nr:MAG: sensor histidine kinase [Actinomycetota bacterium]